MTAAEGARKDKPGDQTDVVYCVPVQSPVCNLQRAVCAMIGCNSRKPVSPNTGSMPSQVEMHFEPDHVLINRSNASSGEEGPIGRPGDLV
jgi:hypothetical protein